MSADSVARKIGARRRFSARRGAAILLLLAAAGLAPPPPACRAAPSYEARAPWAEAAEPYPGEPASGGGACSNWRPGTAIVDENEAEYDGTQPVVQAGGVDRAAEPWRGGPATETMDGRTFVNLAKKDVFTSRGWGAGGMPFSVLYMNPRVNHSPSSGSSQTNAGGGKVNSMRKNGESSPANRMSPIQANYPAALRNVNAGQLRRHYSIIPQLFISYGWGPSGK